MTIGRIPKVDPGATQPQDRKPSPPAGRAGFKTAPSGRIGCRPNRRSPHPAPPSNRRPRRPSRRPRRPRARPTRRLPAGKPAHPQTSSQAPEGNAQGSAKAFWQQQAGASTGSARPAPKRETIIRSNSRKRLRHNPRRKRREAGRNGQWLEPVPRNPNRTNSLPRPSPAGNSSTTTTQPSGRPKPAQPSTARAPDPGGSMPKLALANTELSRFAQAQDKWYQDGQVTLTSDIVKTVTADHVRLFPATRRQSNSSTSRSPEALLAMRELPIESFQAAEISGYMQATDR